MTTNDKYDNPNLTAFALGELEGEEELLMAQMIENDPDLKKEVEAIRGVAKSLETDLQNEAQGTTPRLSVAEREEIFAATIEKKPWWKSLFVLGSAGGVAVAAIALVMLPNLTRFQNRAERPMVATETLPTTIVNEGVPSVVTQGNVVARPPVAKDIAAPVPTKSVEEEMDFAAAEAPVPAEVASVSSLQDEAQPATEAIGGGLAMPMSIAARGGYTRSKVGGLSISKKTERRSMPITAEDTKAEIEHNTESYSHIAENEFQRVSDQPLSTFSIDVDTASYANMRRYLKSSQLPPIDAVRIEEMVNYFRYDYQTPRDGRPFAVNTEVSAAPWNARHKLVRIGLKGKETAASERPASNLVFLIDVSGSMEDENKLPLLRNSFKLLTEQLRAKDKVAMVVYAGSSGVVLPSTPGSERQKILDALDKLSAGGSTNGASGIQEAYEVATKSFIKGGVNRVILATDGDFNVGMSSEGELVRLIEEKAKTGVFLSVLGFGMGNYKDSMMQKLANKGNGNHAYIDSIREAKKVLVEQAGGTLNAIAKDVKIQVEFNPAVVQSYRLIGYEKRMLAAQDFNDDKKDAGEIGEGHTVTALYEVVPHGVIQETAPAVDDLKYQSKTATPREPGAPHETSSASIPAGTSSDEMMTVKLRYKKPDGDVSEKFDVPVRNQTREFTQASSDMKFAASVAGFGMLLRDSKFKGDLTFEQVKSIAQQNKRVRGSNDEYRDEFVELVETAQRLKAQQQK